eukprot:scaffold17572_cov32-Tisochrysis_lutea.AAC.8
MNVATVDAMPTPLRAGCILCQISPPPNWNFCPIPSSSRKMGMPISSKTNVYGTRKAPPPLLKPADRQRNRGLRARSARKGSGEDERDGRSERSPLTGGWCMRRGSRT